MELDIDAYIDLLCKRIRARIPFVDAVVQAITFTTKAPKSRMTMEHRRVQDLLFYTDGVTIYINEKNLNFNSDSFAELALVHELLHIWLGHVARAHLISSKEQEKYNQVCDEEVTAVMRQLGYSGMSLYSSYLKTHFLWYEKNPEDDIQASSLMMLKELEHCLKENKNMAMKVWQSILESMKEYQYILNSHPGSAAIYYLITQDGFGTQTGNGENKVRKQRKKKDITYKDLLYQYSYFETTNCEMDEEIDLILYSYGFDLYSDITLVEPPEEMEKATLCLYLAIDVSGSCVGEVVEHFLSDTYEVISEISQNKKVELDIVLFLCDTKITQEIAIHCLKDFPAFDTLNITGGGTDFRPVFQRVTQLNQEKDKNGALFFYTDGWGKYPEKPPEFDTYFLMEYKDYKNRNQELRTLGIKPVKLEG